MRTHSHEEMQSFAADFVGSLSPRAHATVVALSGELGAGKTTFVQGAARSLGVGETVSSPTFVIEKIYALSEQKWDTLVHIDAYRLNSGDELLALGWQELLQSARTLVLIEWPERVPGLIPEGAVNVRFDIEGEERRITIDGGEESGEKNS